MMSENMLTADGIKKARNVLVERKNYIQRLVDQTIKRIEKLNIKEGDVFLVKLNNERLSAAAYEKVANQMQNFTWSHGFRNVQIIIIDQDVDITLLNEEQMKNLGWVRAGGHDG